ncbi:MAG: type II toxin-antitoxin system RelE/ParE family toxin [Bacteroidota bacterium]|nr:type II toxin-antitoxin system RelE/ParE family toxin [Bacteroidota bacterium]
MAFEINVKEEAKQDIDDAIQWFASKAENLDIKFLLAVEETLFRIKHNPFAFKKVYKKIRQPAVKRFPYLILYEPEQNMVVDYSVFNTW